MKTYCNGSVFLVKDEASALDSRNVSELVVEKGLDIVLRRNDIKVASNYCDNLCTTKSTNSGVDPPVIIDLSNATWEEAGKACDHIFLWAFGKYQKVEGIVESVTNNKNKIILLIQRKEKTWKIPFSLKGVTWPRGEEPYADEAFELLRQSIVDKRVEVLLDKFDSDSDGYFMGTLLLESNTHVAIPS
ncbi:PREDICTED: uncharacterized protein LOC107881736 [Prunus mume]|uniref:Uncharacterized protein LOC107881736 n=1 Tax=Prunus mume TaxID=102107 RepID=A0ABM1LWF7_PRUMU|nr:PREDICTED: uncharacterized protein LOC107881736 [Prunus mume]XP_016651735.1 PREDICTED: uncharacterized protein LOC107881736 [Prunus mume]